MHLRFWPALRSRKLRVSALGRADVALRILIVDDSGVIRQALRSCIESNTGWEVCGEAENGKIAVHLAQQLKPDVVVLDLKMPTMNGLEGCTGNGDQ